jgi:hypothetical protein
VIPLVVWSERNPFIRTSDEVDRLSGGDAVIGGQAAVRDLADQRGQGVGDQSRRDG